MPQKPNMWGPWTSIDRTQYPRSGPPDFNALFGDEDIPESEATMPLGSYPKAPPKNQSDPIGVPYSPMMWEDIPEGTPKPSAPVQGLQGAFGGDSQQGDVNMGHFGSEDPPEVSAGMLGRGNLGAQDPLELSRLRGTRENELKTRAIMGNDQGGRTQRALSALQGDIAEDPYTGDVPHAQNEAYMGRLQKAREQGYGASGDPIASMNEKSRAMEEEKTRMPLQVARAQNEGDLAKQKLVNEGGLAAIESKGNVAQENLSSIRALFTGGGAGANAAAQSLRSVNPNTGAVSFGAPQKPPTIPPADDRLLTTLRKAVADKGDSSSTYFGLGPSKPSPEKVALDQAIGAVIARRTDIDPSLTQAVQGWTKDPRLKDMDLDQILQTLGEDQVTPEEYQHLQELLYYIRGR